MFRRPRQTEPDRLSIRLRDTLQPLTVVPWGSLAMWYLGVPIGVGVIARRRLRKPGFRRSVPNRSPPPEIIEVHPNPQQMLDEINAGYKRLDQSCTVFDYPHGDPAGKGMQLYLFPDSFAHIFQQEHIAPPSVEMGDTASTERFNVYGNLHYPLGQALVESFVKSAIDEEINTSFSAWGESLSAWVSQMTGYLEVNNDILIFSIIV
ncbi:hypothetical protein MferCBS31731_007317 [Microsporum ferrugineum]